MPELIHQILALPRSAKWHLLAILTEELRKEEEGTVQQIPNWQLDLATEAMNDIKHGKVKPMEQDEFWASIDAKIEQLEKR